MIALSPAMKSETLAQLTEEQRKYISELIAIRYLDGMSNRDLETFFLDAQRGYLDEYTTDELLTELSELVDEDEFDYAVNYSN